VIVSADSLAQVMVGVVILELYTQLMVEEG
jgi:hypothetical protein